MKSATPLLSSRFDDALVYARKLHAFQNRKKSAVPYFAHLMSVAALVLEAGGDEEIAIAALLHDAVEDQGGKATLSDIRKRFGDRVADIVDSCSDSYSIPKAPWRKRKEEYIRHLNSASPESRLVSLADKLHNARSIRRDLIIGGESIWRKFNGGKDGTLWYYHALVDTFKSIDKNFQIDELERVVVQIENLAGSE